MLSLTSRLEPAGYGRIGFAFNVVFWLVLLVRDGVEVIAARELARHPRLIRPLVNHVLAVKGLLAIALFTGLVAVGSLTLSDSIDRMILSLYGLMLLTTALGLDFVYRGTERMALVAVSLSIRTLIYAFGVWYWVTDVSRIVWVPALLALGEVCGIALVWACYIRTYGVPRPVLGGRFLRVFLRRGRSVCLIQVSQTVIGSADFMVVGLMSQWADVGRYGAPHQMITAVLTFGLIFQQVVFPTLARSWRKTAASGRHALNALVQVLVAGMFPMAVGGTILAGPLVRFLPEKYAGASLLLALGIWKAPLLNLAYLYQTTLIAVNREAAGVRMLLAGAIGSGPMVAIFCWFYGLAGATAAVLLIAFGLVIAGYGCLAREGRQPAWHHHLALPMVASLAMIPVCLVLQRVHVLAAVGGGILTYIPVLAALGGFPHESLRAIFHRSRTRY